MNLLLINKKKPGLLLLVLLMFSFIENNSNAQTKNDSTVIETKAKEESIVIKPHSPHKASLYSAVLPGLGQAYNKKYWKIPILYAGFAGLVYAIDFNTRYYNMYRRGYRDWIIQDPNNTSYEKVFEGRAWFTEEFKVNYASYIENTLENGKDYYEKWRNLSYVGFALVYVINIIDATVDAHFKTFDVSDDLSMRVEPIVQSGFGNNSIGLQLRLVF